jgi:hypothetical protein
MYFPNLTFLGVEAPRVSKFSVTRIAPPDARAFAERANWFERQLYYEPKKLKPRYPASGSRAARAELPAAIRAYQ